MLNFLILVNAPSQFFSLRNRRRHENPFAGAAHDTITDSFLITSKLIEIFERSYFPNVINVCKISQWNLQLLSPAGAQPLNSGAILTPKL